MFALTTVVVLFTLSYTFALFLVSRRKSGSLLPPPDHLFFVFVVPCLNEAVVIERSIERLLSLGGGDFAVLVIDDASTDDTASIVERFESERVWLLRRSLPDARKGKGQALNAAYRHLLRDRSLPVPADQTVVCVLDADGRLADNALVEVAPYFRDPQAGAVQIGVRMYNASEGLLPRLQDFEFVTYTEIFQRARQQLGSVGLGGNGQFTRLSALADLGERPWTDCLTEDLELGVRLRMAGSRNHYCPRTYVSQQAVTKLRPLVRQRSRWFQGHLQCWRQIAPVLRSRLPTRATFDLVFHLTSPALVLLLTPPMIAFVAGVAALGISAAVGTSLQSITADGGRVVILWYVLSFGLAPFYGFSYWLQARDTSLVKSVALAHLFSVYSYLWLLAGWRAVFRIVTGRRGWAKTARTAEVASEPPT
ncbi:MAG: glycosyltransferase family 2 protein [Actinobacteria bacterium]|nr:MAG: glycosyltransferase family 2 protein [Actinomycetota bacterium]